MSEQAPDEAHKLMVRTMYYYVTGDMARSDAALVRLVEDYGRGYYYDIASVLAYRNEADKAFEWIQRAVEDKDPNLGEPLYDPIFANVVDDPRWEHFLQSIGKSQAQLDAIEFTVKPPKDTGPAART